MGHRVRIRLALSAATGGTMLLAACGGGGGVQSTPTPVTPAPTPVPTPTPTPVPTPTPTPTPTGYDTTEYRNTLGAVDMNALAAYQAGATGKGIGIAIIDSGIDQQSAEFDNRVSPASQNVAGTDTSIDDEGGHGTAVAFTAAGRSNGAATQGVAFDATLIVLRADSAGTCASTDGCSFGDDAIARGINVATANGARVINMSLGGDPPSGQLVAAINRATAAGVIIVIAAGNDSAANPDAFAEVANNVVARNLVIVAGSINPPVGYENSAGEGGTPDTISDFSNKAGDAASHYLAADGVRVRAPDENDTPYLWSGTSFAAPQISAAVALLAQAFPTLTGAQIVDILFKSARDVGDPGIDSTYGNGILDLTRAFQPLGATSLAGSMVPASLTSNASLSAPMGDAQGTLGAVILDGYSRAFAIDLARTINRLGPAPMLTGALQTRNRSVNLVSGNMTLAMTIAPRADGSVALDRTTFSDADARQGRAIAGMVTQRMGAATQIAFGFAEGGAALATALVGAGQPAFLVAGDATGAAGFQSAIGGASAVRQRFGRWGADRERGKRPGAQPRSGRHREPALALRPLWL